MLEAWLKDNISFSGLIMESEENYNIEDISDDENNTFNGLFLPAKSVANLSGNAKSDFEGHIIFIMETQFSDEDNMISVDSCEFNRILRTRACHFLCQCLILTPQVIMSYSTLFLKFGCIPVQIVCVLFEFTSFIPKADGKAA